VPAELTLIDGGTYGHEQCSRISKDSICWIVLDACAPVAPFRHRFIRLSA